MLRCFDNNHVYSASDVVGSEKFYQYLIGAYFSSGYNNRRLERIHFHAYDLLKNAFEVSTPLCHVDHSYFVIDQNVTEARTTST